MTTNIATSTGITTTTIQAPSTNFATVSVSSTTPVTSAPTPLPQTRRAIIDTTVSSPPGMIPKSYARYVMPRNITIEITPSAVMTACALRPSGGLSAWTPLDTASTPVSAVQPAA